MSLSLCCLKQGPLQIFSVDNCVVSFHSVCLMIEIKGRVTSVTLSMSGNKVMCSLGRGMGNMGREQESSVGGGGKSVAGRFLGTDLRFI